MDNAMGVKRQGELLTYLGIGCLILVARNIALQLGRDVICWVQGEIKWIPQNNT